MSSNVSGAYRELKHAPSGERPRTLQASLVANGPSPHIAPRAAMIAEDFARVRVLATESIATPMVEGARTRTRAKDRRGRGQRGL